MKKELMNKCIKLSRVIIALLVFTLSSAWFLFENDPQWVFSIIVSLVVYFVSSPASKTCKFIIKKGDKIKNKTLRVLFYLLLLPIVFVVLLFLVLLIYVLVGKIFFSSDSIQLSTAVFAAFIGIGILICIMVPYFQTIIILLLRYFLGSKK